MLDAQPDGVLDAQSVLVVARDLPDVDSLLGTDVARWKEAHGGLVEGEVPSARYDELLAQVRGSGALGRLGVMAHQDMHAAFLEAPRAALVRGNPMDYHGKGTPLAAARGLTARDQSGVEGEGVLVGVVDTGMRSHPWLDGGYLASPNDFERFDGPDVEPVRQAQAGHGTFVTGLILQQAPAAGVWVERALERSGSGKALAVADAARRLAKRGVHVLNLSLGCFDDEPGALPVMQQMVDDVRADRPGIVIVASAGNLGGTSGQQERGAFWPASLRGVVAVGAVTPDENGQPRPADWSNWGAWVDLAAPGTDLLSTYLYDPTAWGPMAGPSAQDDHAFRGWAFWSGTSFSAAIVSGRIARLMTDRQQTAAGAVELLQEGELRSRSADDEHSVPVVEAADWSKHLYVGRERG